MTLTEKVKALANIKDETLDSIIEVCSEIIIARVRKYINYDDETLFPSTLEIGVLPCIISDYVMCTVPYKEYVRVQNEENDANVTSITESDRKVTYDVSGVVNGKAIDDIMKHYSTDLNMYRRITIPKSV